MIRVAIAQEHQITRWALGEAFAKASDIAVVGNTSSIDATLALVRTEKPDVLVLDMTLPNPTGVDVLAALKQVDGGTHIVVHSPHGEASYGAHVIDAGAHGYVLKSAGPEELVRAVRTVMRGERVVPAEVEALLAAGDGHPAAALSAREFQVMEMLARGMTNREIAQYLNISAKTVDTHRAHVLKKLVLRNNAELARFAVRHGYITV